LLKSEATTSPSDTGQQSASKHYHPWASKHQVGKYRTPAAVMLARKPCNPIPTAHPTEQPALRSTAQCMDRVKRSLRRTHQPMRRHRRSIYTWGNPGSDRSLGVCASVPLWFLSQARRAHACLRQWTRRVCVSESAASKHRLASDRASRFQLGLALGHGLASDRAAALLRRRSTGCNLDGLPLISVSTPSRQSPPQPQIGKMAFTSQNLAPSRKDTNHNLQPNPIFI
jgi:hypothetical protein